ncbi:MAG: TolC family protein [Parasphingorhabdus sp.]|uniref:TolC family protein n=1 Tax=Parasphingorhabdus sp. TaxID=2709688 RepID=UPI0030035104
MKQSAFSKSFSRSGLAALTLGALAVGGCATIKPATDAETATSAQASLPVQPADWTSIREKVGDVRPGWIAEFNDPQLMELVEEAMANNRNLQAAAANVRRARAVIRQAGSAKLPSVDASGGVQRNQSFENSGITSFSAGLQANWEIDVWGRIEAGQQAAIESARVAEADYLFSQYSIAAAVAQSYFLVIEAEQQVEVAQGIVDALTEIRRIVRLRYRYGFASAYDVSLTESDFATSVDTLQTAKNGKLEALRALEGLLGRYPGADLKTPNALPAVPAPPGEGLPSELLQRRPDIIAAERNIAAAINNRKVSEAARLPSFSLTSTLGTSSTDLGNILDPANIVWTLASNILAPIFDNGRRDAQVDIADADVEATVALYADAAIKAFTEVETALDRGVFLGRRRIALETATKETENALRLSNLQYKEGEIDLIDLLSVQQRLFGAQSNLLALKRAQLNQYLEINLALGGNWRVIAPPEPKDEAVE